ncbi:SGNH/GDSL hydrolase family protein [Streptococcus uberis]|uniref:SGNH/GDSL hydrolase family protein n=1 Tax=Streptococcus uberis TaxID=1349 RepID=UPI003D76DE34
MFYDNTLNLKQELGGSKIKQGDFGSVLSFILLDGNGSYIDELNQKTASISLCTDDKIIYVTTATINNSTVEFKIDKAIPVGVYYVEIKVDNYIFPSDRSTIISIEQGATVYDLKDLIPNYDVSMTLTDILNRLNVKDGQVVDLQNKMNAIYSNALSDHAEILSARGGQSSLDSRLDAIEAKEASDYLDLNTKTTTNASNIASTNSRLNGIIANAGNGTIPTELIDIRTGGDGVNYATAGEAVRSNFTKNNKAIASIKDAIYQINNIKNDLATTLEGMPISFKTSVSTYQKSDYSGSYPFYPKIVTAWNPNVDIASTYRYVNFTLPNETLSDEYSVGIWVTKESISPTNNFKFGLFESSGFTSQFATLNSLNIGYTETLNSNTLTIDDFKNGWYHITFNVNDRKTTNLLVGATNQLASVKMYMSVPDAIASHNFYTFVDYSKNQDASKNKLFGKSVGWTGDSIMNGASDGNGLNGWIGRIARDNGMMFENKAVNGAFMADTGVAGRYSISGRITEFASSNHDYYIFDGGANDYFNRIDVGQITSDYNNNFDTKTYCGALESCIYKLQTTYSTAKIGFIIPYKMQTSGDITAQKAYFDKAVEICQKWGVPYLDLRYACTLNYNIPMYQKYYSDNVHANAAGYDFTYGIVEQWLRKL